jgi:Zn-finger nucleic acid-binding protein
MLMQCPKCKNQVLKPAKLESGLPAMGCPHCSGAFVSLLYYRDWLERQGDILSADNQQTTVTEIKDSTTALHCPKCSKIMSKYNISGEVDNKIDMCGSCDEAWLDGGEWELLKSLELGNFMPRLFTDAWQGKVRKEKMEKNRRERLAALVGPDDIQTVDQFKNWLLENEHKAAIMFYINQALNT